MPQNGLVAWYPFNGNANDASGNGNNGTVHGANFVKDRFGISNRAYHFDGSSTYISGSCSNYPVAVRTVSLWFITNSKNTQTGKGIFGYGGLSCGQSWLETVDTTLYRVAMHCNNNWSSYYNLKPIDNVWHNWVVCTDGASLTRFYIDGKLVLDTTTFYSNTFVQNRDFIIGGVPSPSGFGYYTDPNITGFDGRLDDIAIYNRVLDSTEIQQLYCACKIPAISIAGKSIPEGNAGTRQLQFPVTLSNTYSDTVRIKYRTINNTAQAGSDYTKAAGSLIFIPGQTSKNVSVTVKGDTQTEPDETFYVQLYQPEHATFANDTATGTIRNDDGAAFANEATITYAVKRNLLSTDFQVYPNPVTGCLHIQCAGNLTFTLTDAKGKPVLTKQIQGSGSIEVASLPAGLYFLQNQTTGKVQKIWIAK